MNINNPSLDIGVNFRSDQKETCHTCYEEITSIIKRFTSERPELLHRVEVDTVDFYSDGWYFTIYISLEETELISKMVEKIIEYKPIMEVNENDKTRNF